MKDENWSFIISPGSPGLRKEVRELCEYRNLIGVLVRRNFATMYKQTILGPMWLVISPLLSTTVFTIVFGKFANLPTEGVPDFIFYMAANILWTFFASIMQKVSFTFTSNQGLFGKVYFPRLCVPIAEIITQMGTFLVQFLIFLGLLGTLIIRGNDVHPGMEALLLPALLLQISLLCLGVGLLLSAVTVKYRDLAVVLNFGLQLWMYATPVVYPASMIPKNWRGLFLLNPMAPIIEVFRAGFLGTGNVPWLFWGISWVTVLVFLAVGIGCFRRAERTFLDVI